MSMIFGIKRGRGAVVDEADILRLGIPTERYLTDKQQVFAKGRLGMAAHISHTRQRAALDLGIVWDQTGNAIAFDGRLDNAHELATNLGVDDHVHSEAEIVLMAYLRWGEACFGRFTGDWALCLWLEKRGRLILALDHAGTRTLYYRWQREELLWSTYLETFSVSTNTESLSKEYAASYLSCLPTGKHTPFAEIISVLPGQYIVFEECVVSEGRHWSPNARSSIRYKSEREYDEHFLSVFEQAVARRTGTGDPILAQLSGGMDSTAIVCVSDRLRRMAERDAPILDTLSFFEDSEAASDESTFFKVTEAQRGKAGIHFKTSMSLRTFEPVRSEEGAYQIPGSDRSCLAQERLLQQLIWAKGYRVILAGHGGDEVLGGVPTGLPELANLLMAGNLFDLVRRSTAWCLLDRSPLYQSLFGTAQYAFRLYWKGSASSSIAPPWLSRRLRMCVDQQELIRPPLLERMRCKPHQLANGETWHFIMETLPHRRPQFLFRPEFRYPMLDKDLVEFCFSIPREQLVRPGRRRTLMRRALRGIVPTEILERKRKGFHVRAPLLAFQQSCETLRDLWMDPLLVQEGLIDVPTLRRETERCLLGEAQWSQALMRAVALELWLRSRRSQQGSLC